jgi:ParB-like chromosome segregation protein Spo0J
MTDINLSIAIDDIIVGDGRRDLNAETVRKLADSIEKLGLRHPITVRRRNGGYILVAGRHRLEACKKLGRDYIAASIVTMTNDDARLWEISENLHRTELTKLERDENIAEWIKITERVSVQSAPKPQGGRPEGGISAAARELGIDETDAKRAVKVGSISDEAKEAARDAGLDDNRSALLAVAKESTPEAQVAKVVAIEKAKAGASKRKPVVRDEDGYTPKEAADRTWAAFILRAYDFAEFCRRNSPATVAACTPPSEVTAVRDDIAVIDAWLDRFATSLPNEPVSAQAEAQPPAPNHSYRVEAVTTDGQRWGNGVRLPTAEMAQIYADRHARDNLEGYETSDIIRCEGETPLNSIIKKRGGKYSLTFEHGTCGSLSWRPLIEAGVAP